MSTNPNNIADILAGLPDGGKVVGGAYNVLPTPTRQTNRGQSKGSLPSM